MPLNQVKMGSKQQQHNDRKPVAYAPGVKEMLESEGLTEDEEILKDKEEPNNETNPKKEENPEIQRGKQGL